jgi:hypothetical protein
MQKPVDIESMALEKPEAFKIFEIVHKPDNGFSYALQEHLFEIFPFIGDARRAYRITKYASKLAINWFAKIAGWPIYDIVVVSAIIKEFYSEETVLLCKLEQIRSGFTDATPLHRQLIYEITIEMVAHGRLDELVEMGPGWYINYLTTSNARHRLPE